MKSGSTYLSELLRIITGHRRRSIGGSSNDISKGTINRIAFQHSVVQTHTMSTGNNVKLLQRYHFKPVVLVRNIFDVVVSLHDFVPKFPLLHMGHLHKKYFTMDKDAQIDHLIRFCVPWFLSFYVSWREVEESKELETHWVRYEDIFPDPTDVAVKILDFYGLSCPEERIASALKEIESVSTRKNVGTKGRGKTTLTDAHRGRIHDLARVWDLAPDYFSSIGI